MGGICKGVLEAEMVIRCRLKRIVGRGDWFKFWVDRWIGDSSLCLFFLNLFCVAVSRFARIIKCYECSKAGIVF